MYNEITMEKIQTKSKNEKLVQTLFSGRMGKKYSGKHVVIMSGSATILPSDRKQASKLIETLEKKYPREIPQLIFVPRPETYILWIH